MLIVFRLNWFVLQMSPRDMFYDLLQFPADVPDCRHRTCFYARLNGKKIDNFLEFGKVKGFKEGCTIELVEGDPEAVCTIG